MLQPALAKNLEKLSLPGITLVSFLQTNTAAHTKKFLILWQSKMKIEFIFPTVLIT